MSTSSSRSEWRRRLRLDLVRACADGRLPQQPDRDRSDHWPRHARRAGQDERAFTNLIAEPDASEEAVADAVNDTLKAIAASLLMEQVLAPRFNFTPKNVRVAERRASTTAKEAMTP